MKIARALLLAGAAALASIPARATINNAVSSVTIGGTGQQTQFPFGFVGVAPAYVGAIYTDPSGNQTPLVLGNAANQYQVSLNPASPGLTWGVGGTLTYAPNGQPIPAGSSLTIFRTLPLVQAVSLQNQASYGAVGKSAERASDLLEMQLQQVALQTQRAVLGNVANPPPASLPPAAQAAGQGVCFDSAGVNLIACTSIGTTAVSSAVAPLLAASSIANFRSLLGEGALATFGVGAGLENDGAGNLRTANGIIGDSVSQPITLSFFQQRHAAFGPLTYTQNAASTYWNGFTYTVYAFNGPVTIAVPATDNFLGFSSGQALTLAAGTTATLTSNGGASWGAVISGGPLTSVHFVGETIKMRGSTCPAGSIAEDGSALPRSTYASLFAALGTAWGAGDGSTTFNIPNAQGQFDRNFPGGSVDPGRVMGSIEKDQLHNFSVSYFKTYVNNYPSQTGGSTNNTNSSGGTASDGAPTGAAFGSETRPTNIPALSCIWTGLSG